MPGSVPAQLCYKPNHLPAATITIPTSIETNTFPVFKLHSPVSAVASQPTGPAPIAAGTINDRRMVPGRADMNFLNLPVFGSLPARRSPDSRNE